VPSVLVRPLWTMVTRSTSNMGPAGKGDLRGSVQKWVPQNSNFIRENDEIYDEIYDDIL